MRVFHDSRDPVYRRPYGAVTAGGTVSLSVDVWETSAPACFLRLWVDGKGEKIVPMEAAGAGDRMRFTCSITLPEPELVWYSFIIRTPDGESRYGAREGSTGGQGQLYSYEPPSFQITVYKERPVPEWYKNGIVYQIFPDRFRRGEDWQELSERAVKTGHLKGPEREVQENWYETPFYKRNSEIARICWDFYGGTLSGIEEKLDYLQELGVTVIYLNPIFEAASNHRYDTGNYMRIDPMLGGEEAFRNLTRAAEKKGISIILDGVFNHSGNDSLYFNAYGNYPTLGLHRVRILPTGTGTGLTTALSAMSAGGVWPTCRILRSRTRNSVTSYTGTGTAWCVPGSGPAPRAGGWTWQMSFPMTLYGE